MTLAAPDEAIKFILLQRTGLQKLNFKLLRKLGVPYYPHFCNLESRWRRDAILRGFAASIEHDYQQLRAHLPPSAEAILDIGCGVAGIDVALHRHYGQKPPHVYLLDKSTVSEQVFYDFHKEGAYYNSLGAARALLESNGVAAAGITCLEATADNRIEINRPVDLILSTISWGFHYPVSVYLKEAARVLSPQGVLILDVRRDSTGLAELREQFANVSTIYEEPKFLRVLARR